MDRKLILGGVGSFTYFVFLFVIATALLLKFLAWLF